VDIGHIDRTTLNTSCCLFLFLFAYIAICLISLFTCHLLH